MEGVLAPLIPAHAGIQTERIGVEVAQAGFPLFFAFFLGKERKYVPTPAP